MDDVDDFDPAAFWGRLRRRKVFRADTVYALSTMLVYPKFDARPFPPLVAALKSRGIAVRPARPEPYNCPAATPAS